MTAALPVKPEPPVIEMKGVAIGSLRDQKVVVAESVDWTVAVGDYWVVGGLQGSGKSDFLMLAGGVMPPLNGSYRFFGETMPIFEESRLHHRLRLGVVFDGGQLLSHLTVRENIALPLRYHRNLSKAAVAEAVDDLLQTFELTAWADRTPGAIGPNWRQRVGLARALALRPEVLLVDSPLSGLDLRHTTWWLGFLDRLSQGHPLLEGRPLTLVVTAADLRPFKRHARQFAILRDQRLAVLGTWQQLETASAELVRELVTADAAGG